MNIFKILAVLAISVPSVFFAQTAIPVITPNNIPATNARAENTGVAEPDFEVPATESELRTTGTEKEDLGVTAGDDESSNIETEFKVEEGKSDDNNDGVLDNNIGESDAESSVNDDGLIDKLDDSKITPDSFFDVFTEFSDDEARAVMASFPKLDGVVGESKDGTATDGDTADVRSPNKSKEIVVVGSKVRQKVQEGKVEVRGWDPEKKEITIKPEDIQKGEDFLDFIGAVIINDENIETVTLNYAEIKMNYTQPAKLFGFIPMSLTAQVALSGKDKVKVKFPWYTFLTKNNAKEVKKDIDVLSLSWGAVASGGNADLQDRARNFQIISNVMKEAYDTAKASINNIR